MASNRIPNKYVNWKGDLSFSVKLENTAVKIQTRASIPAKMAIFPQIKNTLYKIAISLVSVTVNPVLSGHSKKTKTICFQDQ